jgi:hypothetical protein
MSPPVWSVLAARSENCSILNPIKIIKSYWRLAYQKGPSENNFKISIFGVHFKPY